MTNKLSIQELYNLVKSIFKDGWKIDNDTAGIFLYLEGLGSDENLDVGIIKYNEGTVNVHLTYFYKVGSYCNISRTFDNREELVNLLTKISKVTIEGLEEVNKETEDEVYTYFHKLLN